MPLEIVRNDITRMEVDAIVNAANESLLGGGGVDGAIHQAAGPELLEECRKLHGCRTGEAKITKGYRLPAKYVIHTVGPVWYGGGNGEAELLASCYRNALRLATENHCETVAFPLISAGAYGYPREEALRIAVDAIRESPEFGDMRIFLVIFTAETVAIGQRTYGEIRQYIDDRYAQTHGEAENIRRSRAIRARKARMSEAPVEAGLPFGYKEMASPEIRPVVQSKCAAMPEETLEDLMNKPAESFAQMLFRKIDERGITDAQCYKKANLDRKLFSKIRCDAHYRPGKRTVVALAVALELNLEETEKLLKRAGYAFSEADKFDVIVSFYISRGEYDIFDINASLFDFSQPQLGT